VVNKKAFGLFSLVSAAALYGSYGIFSRLIGESFGAFAQNWIRSALILCASIVLIIVLKVKFKPFQRKDVKWIAIWILFGSTGYLTFIAFNNLPLGTVYFLTYATMIMSSYMAGKFLYKEKLTLVKAISFLLALFGLYLIYSFSIPQHRAAFALIALLSGSITGLWNVLSKKFSERYSEIQLIATDGVFSTCIGFVVWFFVRDAIPPITTATAIPWIWVCVFAIAGLGTTALMIFGFKNIEAQIGSIILPVEIVFAIIFGYFLFGETLTVTALVGGLLIGSAAILPSVVLLSQRMKSKKR